MPVLALSTVAAEFNFDLAIEISAYLGTEYDAARHHRVIGAPSLGFIGTVVWLKSGVCIPWASTKSTFTRSKSITAPVGLECQMQNGGTSLHRSLSWSKIRLIILAEIEHQPARCFGQADIGTLDHHHSCVRSIGLTKDRAAIYVVDGVDDMCVKISETQVAGAQRDRPRWRGHHRSQRSGASGRIAKKVCHCPNVDMVTASASSL